MYTAVVSGGHQFSFLSLFALKEHIEEELQETTGHGENMKATSWKSFQRTLLRITWIRLVLFMLIHTYAYVYTASCTRLSPFRPAHRADHTLPGPAAVCLTLFPVCERLSVCVRESVWAVYACACVSACVFVHGHVRDESNPADKGGRHNHLFSCLQTSYFPPCLV